MTSRTNFKNTWLVEMPMGLNQPNMYETLIKYIRERIENGSTVIDLPNNLYKIQGRQVVYYWYEINHIIILAIELRIESEGLVVNFISKNPNYKGKPPYASDLYNAILDDNNRSIRIISDTQLIDEGYAIWKKLLKLGNKISVYNKANPGQTFTTLNTVEDMDNFFKHDNRDYKQYQFVLSESGEMLAETKSLFNTRRYRELAGLDLED